MTPIPIRTVFLPIRLTPAERREIDRAARAAGMRVSTWARERLLADAGAKKSK